MTGSGSTSNIERAKRFVSCISAGGLSDLGDLCHNDLTMELPFASDPSQKKTAGKQACLEKLAYIGEAFDSFAIVPHELYEAPSRSTVIVEATSFGRYKGGGHFYQNRYVLVLHFENGKVALWREFFNPLLIP